MSDAQVWSKISPLLTCGSELNTGEYCKWELDQQAAHAVGLGLTGPGTASRAWTAIDQTVTEQAPLAAFANNRVEWTLVSSRVRNVQSSPYWEHS